MNDKIIIENDNIANFAMFTLNKLDNQFTPNDLAQIKELTITNNETNNTLPLNDILLFNNLNTLNIRNCYIYNSDYDGLLTLVSKNLENIYFENCEFENADLIAALNIKGLSLINCKINSYVFINILKNLKQLSIVNGTIDINNLNTLENLIYLQLSYSKIIKSQLPITLQNLQELHIDNTNITNLSFVKKLNNLKKLSIDERQYLNNQDLITTLRANKITVTNENMTEFGDER